jgi:hypothetical protein
VAYGSGLFRTGLVAVVMAASAPLVASCQTGPGYYGGGGYYGDSYSSWYDNDNRDWGYDRDRYRSRYRERDDYDRYRSRYRDRDDDDGYRHRRRDRDDHHDDDRRDRRSNSDSNAEQRFWKLFGKDGRSPDD